MKNIIALLALSLIPFVADAAPRQVPAGYVDFTQTDAVTESAQTNRQKCYIKLDGKKYCRDSAGTERKIPFSGEIGNADITPSAAIEYSKLDLADSIVNADINSAAAIDYSKLDLAGSIHNADISPSAAIDYSKLNLAGSVENSDLANMAEGTIKARLSAGAGSPEDVTPSALTAELDVMVGDSGAGGVKGLVPAPGIGDSLNCLKGDGSFGECGGGAGAGINLITLDTEAESWASNASDNFNLEATVGDWLAYADTAGTSPVDMTGGSPTTTCTRITSGQLNGVGSLQMDLGTGSSRQGEGCSVLVNIPKAYRGKNLAFTFPFQATGALVEDDLKLSVYDVTGAQLITPFQKGKILGSAGQAIGVFSVPSDTAQIRVGIHVARTSTGSLSLVGDDFQVSPQIPAQGGIVTKWTSYTPTYTGFGTVSQSDMEWRRNGDSLELRGSFVSGTATASEARVGFPAGLSAIAMTAHPQRAGAWTQSTTLAGNGHVLIGSGESYIKFGYETGSSAGVTIQDGNGIITNGVRMSINAHSIPIAGWGTNVTVSESSTYWISSFLANGTRVTSTPTKLGEYRSFLRQAGARTFTETNGAPAAAPSVADGIVLYKGNAFSSADTNNNPTRYDIFVGKNKNVFPQFHQSAGRTGYVGVDSATPASGVDVGYTWNYDPTTGIFSVAAYRPNGSTTAHHPGFDQGGDYATGPIYFDLKVSENALAVTTENPRSRISVHTANGVGSTSNNRIRRFTTVGESVGPAITYADSSADGASFTINEDGIYAWTYSEGASSTGTVYFAMSKNAGAFLTTIIGNLTAQYVPWGFTATESTGEVGSISWSGFLPAGTVLRPHIDSRTDVSAPAKSRLFISKIGN